MVTFAGSCLNRASSLRGSDEARPREGDLFLVHWRGKFAVDTKNACEIALLRYPHKLISHEKILFLGKNENASFFAVDISEWEPAYQEEPSDSFLTEVSRSMNFLVMICRFGNLEVLCI